MRDARVMLLPSYGVLAVTGRDARTFLQGQLTNDLLGLDRHPGMLAAACNRQGRVIATMRLAAMDDAVLIVLRRELVPIVVAQLAQFVLRADVSITDASVGLHVMGLLDAEPDAHWSQAAVTASSLSFLVCSPRRILLVGSRTALDTVVAAVPRGDPAAWEHGCIADGEPAIHADTSTLWLPQMLNLDLIAAISFTKGCYVGQEIVARAQHLGRIKRRMLRYVAPAGLALHPGQSLYCGESPAAQIVTAAADAAASHCLAVVELAHCADLLGLVAGGSEFVPAGLPYAIPAPETVDAEG